MSRVTLALGSFVLGGCCMYLLGSHTSITVQSVLAQDASKGITAGTAIHVPNAEPVVPPLQTAFIKGFSINGTVKTQALDGLNCDGCVIDALEVTYAGGALRCVDCKVKGDRVTLKGAALNTLIVLQNLTNFMNVPEGQNPNAPHVSIATNKRDIKLTLVTTTQ